MGRQFNFFMTKEDEFHINSLLLAEFSDLVVLSEYTKDGELQIYGDNNFLTKLDKRNRYILTEHSCLRLIEIYESVEVIDPILSPVIQYDTCSIDHEEKIITRGRLYYVADYYSNQNTKKITKDDLFLKFCAAVIKKFKNSLFYSKERGVYLGENARILKDNGWKLLDFR